jgi:hypothetical protein
VCNNCYDEPAILSEPSSCASFLAEYNNDRATFHLCARRRPYTPGSLRAPRAVASGKATLSDVASREECAQHGDAPGRQQAEQLGSGTDARARGAPVRTGAPMCGFSHRSGCTAAQRGASKGVAYLARNWKFESSSLQRRVRCELGAHDLGSSGSAQSVRWLSASSWRGSRRFAWASRSSEGVLGCQASFALLAHATLRCWVGRAGYGCTQL